MDVDIAEHKQTKVARTPIDDHQRVSRKRSVDQMMFDRGDGIVVGACLREAIDELDGLAGGVEQQHSRSAGDSSVARRDLHGYVADVFR